MSDPVSNTEQTTRALRRFARLILPGCLAGLIAGVGVAIWGTGPLGAPAMILVVGLIAFVAFYVQAKRTSRG